LATKNKQGHIHAASYVKYGQDLAENPNAWELWEYAVPEDHSGWIDCYKHPVWEPTTLYRRKTERPTAVMRAMITQMYQNSNDIPKSDYEEAITFFDRHFLTGGADAKVQVWL